jgi:hypothetical protein
MATPAQIEANRRNAEKSSGPRSVKGKSVSRFNALKSGIYAQAQVIPGEDAEELEALAASYQDDFLPETGPEWFLVDSMLRADWQMRRLQKIETRLWEQEIREAEDRAKAYQPNEAVARLERRMDAVARSFFRALKEMKEIIAREREAEEEKEAGRRWDLSREVLRRLAPARGARATEPTTEEARVAEAAPAEPEAVQAGVSPSQADEEKRDRGKSGSFQPTPGKGDAAGSPRPAESAREVDGGTSDKVDTDKVDT